MLVKFAIFLASYSFFFVYFNAKLFLIFFDSSLSVQNKIDILSYDMVNYCYPIAGALIKILLKANEISTKNRDTGVEEDISLNSLLSGKGKTLIEKIYGRDFFYLLENLFLYEYGFNLRNALMHGEGLNYLDKQYADICFYVLVVLISRGGVLEDE